MSTKKEKKVGKFLNEFKAFAMRGNVIDLAVGVVIGGAFGKITSSIVNDIIMPAISMLTGGINFSDWKIVLKEAVTQINAEGVEEIVSTAVTINYGNLISIILDFIIIAFAVFCMVKVINSLHRKKEEPAPEPEPEPIPEPSAEEKLLAEIRDLLKENNN